MVNKNDKFRIKNCEGCNFTSRSEYEVETKFSYLIPKIYQKWVKKSFNQIQNLNENWEARWECALLPAIKSCNAINGAKRERKWHEE